MAQPSEPHRAGLLIPSSNTLIEPEYYAAMPAAVSVHFARLRMTALTDDGIREQDRDIAAQAALLATARVGVILFCQTAASFHLGHRWDAELRRRIEDAAGVPALTAAGTVIDALRVLGVVRLAIATPFPQAVNASSQRFLEAASFEVVASRGLGITDNFTIARLETARVAELVRSADHAEAEAILVPGGNMPCLTLVEALEAQLGKPIVTTNQSGIRAICRHFGLGAGPSGYGRLLARY